MEEIKLLSLRTINILQLLIHPAVFLVKGEVHKLESIGELEHCVVGDGTAISAVKAGGVQVDLNLVHHIDVGGAGERSNGFAVIFLGALSLLREIVDIRDAFF